jgi:hypothetical protein
MQPWSSVVLHAGGSPNALDRVEQDEAIASVNGLFLPEHFLRMTDIPEPHNLFVSHSKVRDLLPNVVDKTEWPPYQVASAGQKLKEPAISEIFVNFFSPLHDVTFTYEPWFRRFTRSNGGVISEAHPRNVLVLEAPIDGIKEYGRLDIALSGEGKLLLFHSGTITNGLWQKSGTHEPFVFTDAYGNPLQFSAGQTWMIVLPSLDRVSWE